MDEWIGRYDSTLSEIAWIEVQHRTLSCHCYKIKDDDNDDEYEFNHD